MNRVPWQDLEERLDAAVDWRWAEDVIMQPWIEGGYTGKGSPDPARPVIYTVGALERMGSTVTTGGGIASGAFSSRIAESAVWLSIQQKNLKGYEPIKDDRVIFPDRNYETYAVTFLEPSDTFRPNVHLVALPPSRWSRWVNARKVIPMPTQTARATVT